MSQYFPKPFEPFGGDVNVKVDLSNYATKIDKLLLVPVDLSKLSDVVKNDVIKNTVYDKLVEKVNNIDTTKFALKTTHDTDKSDLAKILVMQTKRFLTQVI